jgi:arylsulfatase A-like enzyme
MPNLQFLNGSGLGLRGDAILQLDWCVGQLLNTLDSLGLTKNTLVVFSSDNGPVVDDGYADGSVEQLNGHQPAGPLREGKYSKFEGGTRVPFIARWPGKIVPGVSNALVSQVDFIASFAALTHQSIQSGEAIDSHNILNALFGKSTNGRDYLVEEGYGLAIIKDQWKYIPSAGGPKLDRSVNIELGNDVEPQLYDLSNDLGKKNNVAKDHPDIVREMEKLLRQEEQLSGYKPGT